MVTKYEGPYADAVLTMGQNMNFSCNYVMRTDNIWGTLKENKTWSGMIGSLTRHEVVAKFKRNFRTHIEFIFESFYRLTSSRSASPSRATASTTWTSSFLSATSVPRSTSAT